MCINNIKHENEKIEDSLKSLSLLVFVCCCFHEYKIAKIVSPSLPTFLANVVLLPLSTDLSSGFYQVRGSPGGSTFEESNRGVPAMRKMSDSVLEQNIGEHNTGAGIRYIRMAIFVVF